MKKYVGPFRPPGRYKKTRKLHILARTQRHLWLMIIVGTGDIIVAGVEIDVGR